MTRSNLKTHRNCKKCNQLIENKFFKQKAEGKKTEYFSICKKCEADVIKMLISAYDEQRSDYSDNVRLMYENYNNAILNMIFWGYSYLNDTENLAAEIMYSIFYTNIDSETQKEKKAKIKSYDPQKGSFKNWLITIVKNDCKNQIAKQTLIGDKRIKSLLKKENKIKKMLVDILTARISNEPVSTSRMGSLTDEEWNKTYKELYQDNPESNLLRKDIEECVKKGLMRFRNEKFKNWRAAQFIMQEKSTKDIANELGKSVDNAKVFMSESRKKLKPYIEKCL